MCQCVEVVQYAPPPVLCVSHCPEITLLKKVGIFFFYTRKFVKNVCKVTKKGFVLIWENARIIRILLSFPHFFNSVEDSVEICWEPRAFSALPTVQHSGALPSRLSLISLPDSYTLPTEINNTYWEILSSFFKGIGRRVITII